MAKNIHKKAFSIIELLLVLVVIGIILFVIMPFSRALIGKNRALAYTEELRAALRFTRMVAVMLGEPVKFCGSKNHQSCDGLWQEGQIVITETGKIIRVLPKIYIGDQLTWHGSFGVEDFIVFLPTGFSRQQGSFYYCPRGDEANALAVILRATGRVRVANTTADGRTISCNY